jgi:hypothetical protein
MRVVVVFRSSGVRVLFVPKLTFRAIRTSEFKSVFQAWQPISRAVRSLGRNHLQRYLFPKTWPRLPFPSFSRTRPCRSIPALRGRSLSVGLRPGSRSTWLRGQSPREDGVRFAAGIRLRYLPALSRGGRKSLCRQGIDLFVEAAQPPLPCGHSQVIRVPCGSIRVIVNLA